MTRNGLSADSLKQRENECERHPLRYEDLLVCADDKDDEDMASTRADCRIAHQIETLTTALISGIQTEGTDR